MALPVALTFSLLAGLAALAGYLVLEPELEAEHRLWMLSHFAVDYQSFGFVKRGLVGSLVDVPADPAAVGRVAALSLAMLLAALGAAVAFVRQTGAPLALAVAFAVSPGTFQNFAFDVGRFDQIGAVLCLLSILALRRGIPGVAPVAVFLGVLIHEAFALLFLPLIVAVASAEARGRVAPWLAPALAGGVATAAVLLFGGAEPEAIADFFAKLGPFYYPLRIWVSPLGESVAYASGHLLHADTLRWSILPSAGFLAVNAVVLGRMIARAAPGSLWLMIPALAPVALVLVGIDIPRWSALAVFNLFTVALLGVRDASRLPWLLAALAPLGPLGIAWAFPGWLPAQ